MRNTQHGMSCLHPSPKMKTILIVDASPDFRRQVQQLLADYCWLEASDGVQGLKMIQTHHPDLLLCDLQLPVLSGFELIEEVRRYSTTLPILVLSTPCELALVAKVLRLGIQDFIFKPITDWAALKTNLYYLLSNMAALPHARGLTETLAQSLQHYSLHIEHEREERIQTQELHTHLEFIIKQPILVRRLLYALLPKPENSIEGWYCHYVLLQDIQMSPLLFDAAWIAKQQFLFYLLESSVDILSILKSSLLVRPLFYDYLRQHSAEDIQVNDLFYYLHQAVANTLEMTPLTIMLGKLDAKTGRLSLVSQGINVLWMDEKGEKRALAIAEDKNQETIMVQQKISLMIEQRRESRFTLEIARS